MLCCRLSSALHLVVFKEQVQLKKVVKKGEPEAGKPGREGGLGVSQPTTSQLGTESELRIKRYFTTEGVHPYDEVEWDTRDALIQNYRTGEIAFEQRGVEIPRAWSQNATNIVAQKYFRGSPGTPERERSVKQMIDRVVDRYHEEGIARGYFADDDEAQVFADELRHLLVTQKAAFNSPVWFNVGWRPKGEEQCSACFILSVDDEMSSILNWYVEEGLIFKHGSGSGLNLSKIRSSRELLHSGGTASGPVSFMRGADASAGTIKSGGATRRAAKMVVLNVDHPDIKDFIWCKAHEEAKARALREAGFDMDLDGKDSHSIQYQNANNSVRVTDEFMNAVIDDKQWDLVGVTTGEPIESLPARELFREIAKAAWECADPGVQYDTTINDWHTCSNTSRINASNPCSEYMHVDNSSCNLASLNLMKFLDNEDKFDVEGYKHGVEVMFLAQEISVGFASYPTEKIAENSRAFRQLGQGYANLGAMLMAQGLPYDSDEGRAWAAAITSIMTGHCYATSAKIATRVGAFEAYADNREPMVRVINKHRAASYEIPDGLVPQSIVDAARTSWDNALALGEKHGYRNAQATVLAPTGTIGLLMDCDTTGIEPDLALKKMKKLVGGGTMSIVNQTVPRGLRKLGYSDDQAAAIVAYIDEHGHVVGAPNFREDHLPVFDTAMGERSISYMGHIRMMGAAQPFLSGAISKTVNLPEDVTVEDVEQAYIEGWRSGLKALAIYRDNCKVAQPLSGSKKEKAQAAEVAGLTALPEPIRRRLPKKRASRTIKFRVADTEGYITTGEFPDGSMGELFLKVAKQGSTLAGIMDAFAISISMGLQYGVPLSAYVKQFVNTRFEPSGMTDDSDFRIATSILDYVFRVLAVEYLNDTERHALGIRTSGERQSEIETKLDPNATGDKANGTGNGHATKAEENEGVIVLGNVASASVGSHPFCGTCGVQMQPAGSCFACPSCGSTSGCS
jgi:ribonucleoside-diphosphate reductase alpha chain